VPAGLIKQENCVFAGGNGLADFLKMQVHRNYPGPIPIRLAK